MELLVEWWDLLVTAILRGGIYALMAVGLSLVFGVMNIANFAYGELYMLGAYFAYFAFTVLNFGPIPAMIFAAMMTFIVGSILEKVFFYPLRQRAKKQWLMNSFLVTLGISIILQNSAKLFWGSTYYGITQYWGGRIRGISSMSISMDRGVGFLIAVIAITALILFLSKTRTGRGY